VEDRYGIFEFRDRFIGLHIYWKHKISISKKVNDVYGDGKISYSNLDKNIPRNTLTAYVS
jgi:hypothetical protein